MRVLHPVVLSTALLTWSVVASAQDPAPTPAQIKRAARAFDKAKEAYEAEDFATAAVEFESADGYAPSAVALQWAIDSHDQAGHLARSATLAALAKQRYPDVPEINDVADTVIEKAKAQLFQLDVTCDEPCELLVDNKIVHGRAASTRTLYLDPGMYQITASFSDSRMSESQDVGADAGSQNSLNFSPPEAEPEPAKEDLSGMDDPFAMEDSVEEPPEVDKGPAKESSGWHPAVFYVGAALTVAGGAATTLSGIDTLNNPGRKAVKDACDQSKSDFDQAYCDKLYNDGKSKQDRTNILLGVTGGLAVFTIVAAALTDWGSDEPTEQARVRRVKRKASFDVEPWVTVGYGAMLGARARF